MEKPNILNKKTYLAPIDKKLQDSEDTTHPSVSKDFFSVNHKTIQLMDSRHSRGYLFQDN